MNKMTVIDALTRIEELEDRFSDCRKVSKQLSDKIEEQSKLITDMKEWMDRTIYVYHLKLSNQDVAEELIQRAKDIKDR